MMGGSGSNSAFGKNFKGEISDLQPNAWESAGLFSRVFFTYMNDFVRLGHEKPLEQGKALMVRPVPRDS